MMLFCHICGHQKKEYKGFTYVSWECFNEHCGKPRGTVPINMFPAMPIASGQTVEGSPFTLEQMQESIEKSIKEYFEALDKATGGK